MPLAIAVPDSVPLRQAALLLLYGRLPSPQRDEQIAETLAAVERKELSLDDLLVAVDGEQLVGALFGVRRPGSAAFLWPPVVREGVSSTEIAKTLLEELARRFDARDVRFAQCLLEPDDMAGRNTLQTGGFPYVTDLVLMARAPQPVSRDPSSPALEVECYRPELRSDFSRIVEKTYEQTLDCPVLARIRSGEDSLDSHRATGEFDARGWRLYREAGKQVGVVLLASHPERSAWEVAYLGVISEARGRGIGQAILQDALTFAEGSGQSTVEIAVDVANTPALRLYRHFDFTELRRFSVHLRLNAGAA